jgi:lipid-A-disaccharide synthase
MKKILIIAGEPSGELHAANLITALKKINPCLEFLGVGAESMRRAGIQLYADIKDLCVLGIFDALKNLKKFLRLQRLLLDEIERKKISAVILVDFGGFNLRLARRLNKKIPVIYYISPQVWASRPGRIRTIKKYISKLIVIFKFEEEFYKKRGVPAEFIGHPLLDIVRPTVKKEDFLRKHSLALNKPTLTLLPGSRKQEVLKILPIILKACQLVRKKIPDVQFIIAKVPLLEKKIYDAFLKNSGLQIKVVQDQTYDCINAADFCLVASGTAVLETTILEKPFAIIYKTNLLSYLFYLPQVRVPFIGIVNIIARRLLIPEFIQCKAKPSEIADYALNVLENCWEAERIKKELSRIKPLLGEKGASARAARIIDTYLSHLQSTNHKPLTTNHKK